MTDLQALDEYLSSDDAPQGSLMVSDLDGFLTGILCSPELIVPSEWLPHVWGGEEAGIGNPDAHIWATQEVLARYNEIAAALNSEPPHLEPVFWEAPEGHTIAMDWCEGFMLAFDLRRDLWNELLQTDQGQEWLFPVLAHIIDDEGNPLVEVTGQDLNEMLDAAAVMIPETVPKIYTFWKSKRVRKN